MTPTHLAPLPGPDHPTVSFPLTQQFPTHAPMTLEMATCDLAPAPARLRGMRIGDAERDRVCEVLATHFAAGRLSPAELDERTTRAVMATTQAELLRLTADLPTSGFPHGGPATRPAPVWPHDCASAHPLPAPTPRADSGRSTVMVLWGLLTAAATLCTMVLLFGVTYTELAGMVWLAAFGTAVASSGITYFVTRGPAPALPRSR